MKKLFVNFLVLLIAFLILGSVFLGFQDRPQRRLKAEAGLLGEKVALLHEAVARRKALQVEVLNFSEKRPEQIEDVKNKIRLLDDELERVAVETEKSIFDAPSLLARLSVLPKFAELIYAMGRTEKANELLGKAEEQIQKIDDTEVRTSVYVCFAEANIHCRNFDGYERCRRAAEKLVEVSDDSKWQGEMKNTLLNLKMLEKEIRSVQPSVQSEVFSSDSSSSDVLKNDTTSNPANELSNDVTDDSAQGVENNPESVRSNDLQNR